jgi:hypothetical protein
VEGQVTHWRLSPKEAWKPVSLDRPWAIRTRPSVAEDPAATLSNYPETIRQLAVKGLGHDKPTIIIITNDTSMTARAVIRRYTHRMNVEQRLAESIRSFHTDSLSSAVALNVDLDVALSVVASAVHLPSPTPRRLRHRDARHPPAALPELPRRRAQPRGRDRRQAGRKTYNPVLRQADLPVTAVPWWGGRTLRFEYE